MTMGTNSFIGYKQVNEQVTTSVASAADNDDVTITVPVGEIWKIKSLMIFATKPSTGGSGSGTHRIYFKSQGHDIYTYDLLLINDFNADITFGNGLFGVSSAVPVLQADAQRCVFNLAVTNDRDLTIQYHNDTDATTTQARRYRILFERYKAAAVA